MIPDPCDWTEDDDGAWTTTCGHLWEFTSGGPEENGAHFCLFCGHVLQPRPMPKETV